MGRGSLVMSWDFSFSIRMEIVQDQFGLRLPITLSIGGREIDARAHLDTGAAYCVVPRETGERLGLDVEAGEPTSLRTGGGPMPAFLHYANLTIGELFFEDVPVCVAKYPEFDRILLGREGWLQKVRLTLIVYEDSLYLNLHGQ
jgi:predicted aspartyl protease